MASGRRSSGITSILRSVRELGEPVHALGAPPPAQALLLLRWAAERREPITVLCATDDACDELASDLECLQSVLKLEAVSVRRLPTWEQSPYSPIAPSLRTRIERVATLSALSSDFRPRILLTTLAGACQATVPRATLA